MGGSGWGERVWLVQGRGDESRGRRKSRPRLVGREVSGCEYRGSRGEGIVSTGEMHFQVEAERGPG